MSDSRQNEGGSPVTTALTDDVLHKLGNSGGISGSPHTITITKPCGCHAIWIIFGVKYFLGKIFFGQIFFFWGGHFFSSIILFGVNYFFWGGKISLESNIFW